MIDPAKLEELQNKLGIKFRDSNLLKKALTHRSYLNETREKGLESNERLEFLGDSVLSLVTSNYLYKNFPFSPEGQLTTQRSFLVSRNFLAQVAQELDLGQYLLFAKGEAGRGRKNPTLLANTCEALIGAIFLDQGIDSVEKVLQKFFFPKLISLTRSGVNFKDAKSKLQEVIQEKLRFSPQYKVLKTTGPDHNRKFQVGVFFKNKLIATGSGKSKQEAEQLSAQTALEQWEKDKTK